MASDLELLLSWVPNAPDWNVNWQGLDAHFSWVRDLKGCPQDPVWHAEGDVWIHTEMVLNALAADPEWRELPALDRETVFLSALLHDVAKPVCTREHDGRIISPGHSRTGSIMARNILWELGLDFNRREEICGLIEYHQMPFFLIDRPDRDRLALTISLKARHVHLAALARADIRGRHCEDLGKVLDNIELASTFARELDCWQQPYPFESDHARYLYFRDTHRHRFAPAHDDTSFTVTILSGLPGAGKDHWINQHGAGLPVISLDALRTELKIKPTQTQGKVVALARERAREFLRDKQPYIWNATNVSADLRGKAIALADSYGARIRIVYIEAPCDVCEHQNRDRPDAVPASVVARLKRRWTVPRLTEAHELEYVVD